MPTISKLHTFPSRFSFGIGGVLSPPRLPLPFRLPPASLVPENRRPVLCDKLQQGDPEILLLLRAPRAAGFEDDSPYLSGSERSEVRHRVSSVPRNDVWPWACACRASRRKARQRTPPHGTHRESCRDHAPCSSPRPRHTPRRKRPGDRAQGGHTSGPCCASRQGRTRLCSC